jgi:hypothetical protein
LAAYARIKGLHDRQLGLFLMSAAEGSLTHVDEQRLDNIIGEQSWSLEKQGLIVCTRSCPAPLAKDIWERAEVPA